MLPPPSLLACRPSRKTRCSEDCPPPITGGPGHERSRRRRAGRTWRKSGKEAASSRSPSSSHIRDSASGTTSAVLQGSSSGGACLAHRRPPACTVDTPAGGQAGRHGRVACKQGGAPASAAYGLLHASCRRPAQLPPSTLLLASPSPEAPRAEPVCQLGQSQAARPRPCAESRGEQSAGTGATSAVRCQPVSGLGCPPAHTMPPGPHPPHPPRVPTLLPPALSGQWPVQAHRSCRSLRTFHRRAARAARGPAAPQPPARAGRLQRQKALQRMRGNPATSPASPAGNRHTGCTPLLLLTGAPLPQRRPHRQSAAQTLHPSRRAPGSGSPGGGRGRGLGRGVASGGSRLVGTLGAP